MIDPPGLEPSEHPSPDGRNLPGQGFFAGRGRARNPRARSTWVASGLPVSLRMPSRREPTRATAGREIAEGTLDDLRRSAAACTACDLYKRATQTVFGEGNPRADMVLIGEQPGNDEDLAGRPFVGPAGRLLDRALALAGIDRQRLYVTNAVKHFKWKSEAGGKRRIHDTPRLDEVEACRPWFERELWLVEPRVIVCLGVTA